MPSYSQQLKICNTRYYPFFSQLAVLLITGNSNTALNWKDRRLPVIILLTNYDTSNTSVFYELGNLAKLMEVFAYSVCKNPVFPIN